MAIIIMVEDFMRLKHKYGLGSSSNQGFLMLKDKGNTNLIKVHTSSIWYPGFGCKSCKAIEIPKIL